MELCGCNVGFCNFLAAFWLLEHGKVIKLRKSFSYILLYARCCEVGHLNHAPHTVDLEKHIFKKYSF